MRSTKNENLQFAASAIAAIIVCALIFFIGFVMFSVNELINTGDFDAGSLGISASSFFAIGLSILIFRKREFSLFYAALFMVVVLICLVYLYPIRNSVRIQHYDKEFNWIFTAFVPCFIVIGKVLKEKWYRMTKGDNAQ